MVVCYYWCSFVVDWFGIGIVVLCVFGIVLYLWFGLDLFVWYCCLGVVELIGVWLGLCCDVDIFVDLMVVC